MNALHRLYIIALFTSTSLAIAMDINDDDSSRSSTPDQSLSLHNQQTNNAKSSDKSEWGFLFDSDSDDDDDDEPATTNTQPPHAAHNAASGASDLPFPQKPNLPFPEIIPDLDLPEADFERKAHLLMVGAFGKGHDMASIALMAQANLVAMQMQNYRLHLELASRLEAMDVTDAAPDNKEQPASDNNVQSDL